MPAPLEPRKNEQPSTYVVPVKQNKEEIIRLMIQNQMLTTAMGGVLSEFPDPTIFHRVLDIGCGPGGWVVATAQAYPTISLVGIDISQRMIDYACAHARAHHVNDRIKFHVMDALRPLKFSDGSFDLVNLRYGFSFLRMWDWRPLLCEIMRITCPGGVIRLAEPEFIHQTSSPAWRQINNTLLSAFYRAGHFFAQESTGSNAHLMPLLKQYGCQNLQTKKYILQCQAGTTEGDEYYRNSMHMFHVIPQFLKKWACYPENYEDLCSQALKEIQQDDFRATWYFLCVWGTKPRPECW